MRTKNFIGIFLIIVVLFAVSACAKTPVETRKSTPNAEANASRQLTLTVSAASSLKDSLTEIKEIYSKENPEVSITYNFGSSGSLQQQIENGAPVDVFISAAQKQMDALKDKQLIVEETRKNLLGNKLVVVTLKENNTISNFKDLASEKVKKVGLGELKTVPCGQYAEEVLNKLGIVEAVKQKAVFAKDAKEVLTWVESGNADAGVVYETDAKVSAKVKVVATAPEGSHKPIVYPAAAIKSSKNIEAAKEFLKFLSEEKSKIVFEKYGFAFLNK